ncbi:MAG: class I SAM-dependent methyltransferase [Halobacteriaceae archaeon]
MDSHEVRRGWAERSGEYSPAYYAYYGPDERSETVHSLVDEYAGPDASVLELGCSSGRHLAYLADEGYDDLAGVEVNPDAFDVMDEEYPDLADSGTFYCDAIEDVVGDLADGRFDVVFSVETLQHIHPDAEWVFGELARVAGELLVTVENEGDDGDDVSYVNDDFPLYHRNWRTVFEGVGLEQVAATEGKRDTVRAFRPSA